MRADKLSEAGACYKLPQCERILAWTAGEWRNW